MWERTGDGFFTGENVIMDYMLSILARRDILKLKRINDVFVSYKHAVFHFARC